MEQGFVARVRHFVLFVPTNITAGTEFVASEAYVRADLTDHRVVSGFKKHIEEEHYLFIQFTIKCYDTVFIAVSLI